MTREQEKRELQDQLEITMKQLEGSSSDSPDSYQLRMKKAEIQIRLKEIQDLEEIESMRQENHRKEIERMKDICELGKRFQKRTFDTFDSTDYIRQFDICVQFAKRFPVAEGKGLYIFGSAGTGKTHLAAAITNYVIEEKHRQAVFVNHITLLNRIKQSFDTGKDIVSWYKQAPLLVLDDIGKSKVTDWTREVIYDLVNYRYENELSTVFTSNYSIQGLQPMIGPATVSRINEMCFAIEMTGTDRRMEK